MDDVTSKPLVNGFPPTLKLASKTEKRQWLHEHVSKMLNKYVMGSFDDLLSINENLASQITALQAENICRHAGCNKKFTYTKCLLQHESNIHNLHLGIPVGKTNKTRE